jgi:hypothetical protein
MFYWGKRIKENDGGGEFSTFVNDTIYLQYNNNMITKIKLKKEKKYYILVCKTIFLLD